MDHLNCLIFNNLTFYFNVQIRRKESGRKDFRIPSCPDHGVKMLDDYNRLVNLGYPLVERLIGLSELCGMQMAIESQLLS